MVEKDTPGFSRARKLEKMGYHLQDTTEFFFEDCQVPAGNFLGEKGKGFKYMMNFGKNVLVHQSTKHYSFRFVSRPVILIKEVQEAIIIQQKGHPV